MFVCGDIDLNSVRKSCQIFYIDRFLQCSGQVRLPFFSVLPILCVPNELKLRKPIVILFEVLSSNHARLANFDDKRKNNNILYRSQNRICTMNKHFTSNVSVGLPDYVN